jgi:hypothetical protein
MAQIALISKKISPQVVALARGLRSQRHEVQILASHKATVSLTANQNLDLPEDIQVLGYFKKWNWFEAARLLPRFLGRSPEVFHFIFEGNEKVEGAHWLLSSMAQQLGKAVIISLGTAKIETKRWQKNGFLKNNKTVIVPSREKLMYLKRQGIIDDSVTSEVILPFATPNSSSVASGSLNQFQELTEKWRPYLIIPAHPERKAVENLIRQVKSPGLRLLFLGERSEKLYSDLRCISIGQATEDELLLLVEKSQAVLLAAHAFEPTELMRWQRLAVLTETPLVVHRRQVEALPGLCLQGRNGFILENIQEDFHKLLQNHPRLEIAQYQAPVESQSPSDYSLNEVNRLYIRALAR